MAASDSAMRDGRSPQCWPRLAGAIFALDKRFLRRDAVVEYTSHPACLFRLEIGRSRVSVRLGDGTRLRVGQRVARLHYWNEHVPALPRAGATICWARQMQRGITTSLHELARHLADRPDLSDIAVICGDVANGTFCRREQIARIMSHFGFETIHEHSGLPIGAGIRRFGENILISFLVFARNPAALRLDTLWRTRVPIYLSRAVLERKFGRTETAPDAVESL